jgi:hypothetical protein
MRQLQEQLNDLARMVTNMSQLLRPRPWQQHHQPTDYQTPQPQQQITPQSIPIVPQPYQQNRSDTAIWPKQQSQWPLISQYPHLN